MRGNAATDSFVQTALKDDSLETGGYFARGVKLGRIL